jgi:hypothetical protein
MRERDIWKRFAWEWRYWIIMGVLASPILLHILFPSLLPDWMVHAMAFVLDTY